MNRGLNLPQIQRIMQEFEKESATMDMKEEIMSEAVDDVMDEGLEDEEEEGDKILKQVLDEIGVDLSQQVRPNFTHIPLHPAVIRAVSCCMKSTSLSSLTIPCSSQTHRRAWQSTHPSPRQDSQSQWARVDCHMRAEVATRAAAGCARRMRYRRGSTRCAEDDTFLVLVPAKDTQVPDGCGTDPSRYVGYLEIRNLFVYKSCRNVKRCYDEGEGPNFLTIAFVAFVQDERREGDCGSAHDGPLRVPLIIGNSATRHRTVCCISNQYHASNDSLCFISALLRLRIAPAFHGDNHVIAATFCCIGIQDTQLSGKPPFPAYGSTSLIVL